MKSKELVALTARLSLFPIFPPKFLSDPHTCSFCTGFYIVRNSSPRHILVLVLAPQKTAKASVEGPPDIFSVTSGPITFGFRPKTGVFACAPTPLILGPVFGDKIHSNLLACTSYASDNSLCPKACSFPATFRQFR